MSDSDNEISDSHRMIWNADHEISDSGSEMSDSEMSEVVVPSGIRHMRLSISWIHGQLSESGNLFLETLNQNPLVTAAHWDAGDYYPTGHNFQMVVELKPSNPIARGHGPTRFFESDQPFADVAQYEFHFAIDPESLSCVGSFLGRSAEDIKLVTYMVPNAPNDEHIVENVFNDLNEIFFPYLFEVPQELDDEVQDYDDDFEKWDALFDDLADEIGLPFGHESIGMLMNVYGKLVRNLCSFVVADRKNFMQIQMCSGELVEFMFAADKLARIAASSAEEQNVLRGYLEFVKRVFLVSAHRSTYVYPDHSIVSQLRSRDPSFTGEVQLESQVDKLIKRLDLLHLDGIAAWTMYGRIAGNMTLAFNAAQES